jgi:23S rRNA (cytidine1920-2'-O)/16S rRNA (cytidine1409-2'-O)-methyltransferase
MLPRLPAGSSGLRGAILPRMPRLDVLLVERGLFATREQARRAVMAGAVRVDGRRFDKAGTAVGEAAVLEVLAREPFVSRGGRKLAAALDAFGIDPAGRVCLDVGASTGGFTDCLLQRGAGRVYAVDVGYGQLDQRLREDARVVVRERVNARQLSAAEVPEACSLAVADVSFISLTKVAPAILGRLTDGADFVPLIKPQFEAGRGEVGRGGIVRDPETRRRAIDGCVSSLVGLGLELRGLVDSPIAGAEGNLEALAWLAWPGSRGEVAG